MPCLSAQVQRSARRGSDAFSAVLSITMTEVFGFSLAEWCDFEPRDVSVIFSTGPGAERVMMKGLVDIPQVKLVDMTVLLNGRDKSGSLTEKRRNEKFNNQKTQEIVEKVAKAHKLTPKVMLKSQGADFAGKIYNQDTAHLALNRTDFELLSDLAEREGCRWFVDGDNLHFQPDDQHQGSYQVRWYPPRTRAAYAQANVLDVELRRNMPASRPHKMTLKSWHHRERKLFRAVSEVAGVGDPIEYEDHHSGRTQQQLERLAGSRLKSAIRHELGLGIRGPGDLSVDVRQQLDFSGTGTVYDQTYEIDIADFDMSWRGGFNMVLSATSAKQGREPKTTGSSRGGKSVNADGPATKTVPLPPNRPAGLGGTQAVPLPPSRPSGLGGGSGGTTV